MGPRIGSVMLVTGLVLLAAACRDPAPAEPLEPAGDAPAAAPTAAASGVGPSVCPRPRAATLDDPRITESSGIALSRVHRGVVYTHNDRGALPSLFALDASGTRAVLQLPVPAVDWEDLASTPDGRLWVADTGDNDGVRDSVQVRVVDEPEVLVSSTVPVTTYDLRYADGPHDAEALLVDPRDDRLWVVTKGESGGRVYVAPVELDEDRSNVLSFVTTAPPGISGGAFSPDGRTIALRNQGKVFFSRGFRGDVTEVDAPRQQQGESVTFTADGRYVLLGTEGADSTVRCLRKPAGLRR